MIEHLCSEQLMSLVHQRNAEAFTLLVRRHSQTFFRLAHNLIQDEQEAEDVIQDCFLKIWNKPNLWNPKLGVKFTTWFYKIVFYASLDKIKGKFRAASKPLSAEPAIDPKQESLIDLKSRLAILEGAMSKLSVKETKVIYLCLVKQFSHAEAAEEMNTGIRSLQGILMRAKNRLRDNFLQICDKKRGGGYGRSI